MKNKLKPMLAVFMFMLMGMAGAVFAYFSISAVSSGNTLETGALEIVLSDGDESQLTSISNSWSATNLKPGSKLPQGDIIIRNDGINSAQHLDLTFSYEGSEEVAKSIIFSNLNNGFRYGATTADGDSVNLISALKGGSDVNYTVLNGSTGGSITASAVDGVDGTVEDGKISLNELATFGKISIVPLTSVDGIYTGSQAHLWLNAEVSTALTAQNESIDVSITATLDQDASQL